MPHQCTNCSHVFPDGSKAMLSGCPDCGGNTFQFLPKGAIPTDADDADAASDRSDADAAATADDPTSTDVPVESAEPPVSEESGVPGDSTGSPRETPPARGPIGRATAAVRDWVRVDSPTPSPLSEERAGTTPRSDDAPETDRRVDEPEDAAEPAVGSSGTAGDETDGDDRPAPDRPGVDAAAASDESEASEADDDGIGTGSEDRAQADARRDVVAADDLPATSSDSAASDPRTPTPPPGAEEGRIAAEPSGERPDLDELRRELNDQFESIKIVEPGQYELNLMELYNREEYIIALREDGRYAIEAPETWLGRRIDRD